MSIRVLVVDDSALVRQMLTEMLNSDPGIEVVGVAPDPLIARDKIKRLEPDVLTLDVEMPKMDGLTFLRNLMRLRPMPVVMVSTLTERGADVTLEALEIGAFDFVAKPKIDIAATLDEYADELVAKVKAAAGAKVRPYTEPVSLAGETLASAPRRRGHFRTTDVLVAIGSSTGGTEAVKDVLVRMPADAPAIVISQHIPAMFSSRWAERMDRESRMDIAEARNGDVILPGHVYIAPGDDHLIVERDGARFVCRLDKSDPVNRHRPSVDVMFRSIAANVGQNAIAVLLTGMGSDGAEGMLRMKEAGAPTLIQDEKTSVVWGMPGSAHRLGAADRQVRIEDMAAAVLDTARAMDSTATYQAIEV